MEKNTREKDHKSFISRGEVNFPVCCNSFFPLRKHFCLYFSFKNHADSGYMFKIQIAQRTKSVSWKIHCFLNHAINYEKQIVFPKYIDTIISE